jgi:hypothetical protein
MGYEHWQSESERLCWGDVAIIIVLSIPTAIGLLLLMIFGCHGASKQERERRRMLIRNLKEGRKISSCCSGDTEAT